ncbi:MAG TPA: hypothetical protein VN726_23375 [Hanamia sp.]|nr:hypothetical protein [Hanamia sp.]
MKLKLIVFTAVCITYISTLSAQDKFLDSSIKSSKTNAESHVVTNASDKINHGIDNLFSGNAFKKKNKGPKQENAVAANQSEPALEKGKTQIVISNANYQSLASITDAIKSNVQVTDIEKSFADGVGTLKITHSCTSDQLLDDLVKKVGDKFEVAGVENGRISLKMK